MKSVIFKDKKNISSLIWRVLKWHLKFLFKKTPLPLSCGLYLTNRCNLRCSFCNIWRKPTLLTLPLSRAKSIIGDLSELNCFYLSLTGGEPLLVEYLFDILAYARRSRIKYIHLVTNGYLLDRTAATRLAATGINEVSVSIDGNEEIHDKNRGMSGSYRRAVMAVENLKKYAPGVKVVLNAIFSPENPFQCLHVVELAHRFDVYVKIQPLNRHPAFSSTDHSSISFRDISPEGTKAVITKLRKDSRVVNSNTFLDNIYNFFHKKERLIFRNSPCIFGYHHIEVLEDGNIYPCLEGLNWEKGLKSDLSLKDLLRSPAYKRLVEELKKCKGCLGNYYICYYEPRITFPINNLLRSAARI